MASPKQINLIKALAQKRGLDPRAILAVASQEGLAGGVGDSGTSFGPFQLHVGGALPQNIKGNRQAWAWSPQGLIYALDRIASVASGLHGKEAVNSIVRRFERPANPDREATGALAAYGLPVSTASNAPAPAQGGGVVSGDPSTNPLLQAVLHGGSLLDVIRHNAQHPLRGPDSLSTPLPYTKGTPRPFGTLPGILGQGASLPAELRSVAPAELLSEGTGGPTHSTGPHIHVAYTNPQAMLAAIRLAESLGLHLGENPYVGSVDPVHAKNSYHYRTFPGLFGGKRLGQAIDVSGPNASRLYAMLSRRS